MTVENGCFILTQQPYTSEFSYLDDSKLERYCSDCSDPFFYYLFKRVIFEKKMQEGRPYSCYEIGKLLRINEKLGGQVVQT